VQIRRLKHNVGVEPKFPYKCPTELASCIVIKVSPVKIRSVYATLTASAEGLASTEGHNL